MHQNSMIHKQIKILSESMNQIKSTKQKLADSLGDLAQDYWQALQDYLLSKTTKLEFDTILLTTLTTQTQKHLHNRLLILILSNTGSLNDLGTADFTSKRKDQRGVGKQLKKRFNTKTVIALSNSEKQRLLTLTPSVPVVDSTKCKLTLIRR